jgi:hypothetical protein
MGSGARADASDDGGRELPISDSPQAAPTNDV